MIRAAALLSLFMVTIWSVDQTNRFQRLESEIAKLTVSTTTCVFVTACSLFIGYMLLQHETKEMRAKLSERLERVDDDIIVVIEGIQDEMDSTRIKIAEEVDLKIQNLKMDYIEGIQDEMDSTHSKIAEEVDLKIQNLKMDYTAEIGSITASIVNLQLQCVAEYIKREIEQTIEAKFSELKAGKHAQF